MDSLIRLAAQYECLIKPVVEWHIKATRGETTPYDMPIVDYSTLPKPLEKWVNLCEKTMSGRIAVEDGDHMIHYIASICSGSSMNHNIVDLLKLPLTALRSIDGIDNAVSTMHVGNRCHQLCSHPHTPQPIHCKHLESMFRQHMQDTIVDTMLKDVGICRLAQAIVEATASISE